MAKINSRTKGHNFERWLVNYFNDLAWTAKRLLQAMGGHNQPDIAVEEWPLCEFHFEGKRYKRSSIYKFCHQAERDSGSRIWWCVVLKADREDPVAIMPLDAFEWLAREARRDPEEIDQEADPPDWWITCKDCGGIAPVRHKCFNPSEAEEDK